jgi:beta-N-acetylhexosaminidase
MPIIKHIPGHGRAMVDSHESLPIVRSPHAELSTSDFVPFKALNDIPWAMTAHITYTAIDDKPATLSSKTINVIRHEIGFNGLLLTDDLSMKALAGTFEERTANSLKAGCDIALHCNGEPVEMEAIAKALPSTTPKETLARIARSHAWLNTRKSDKREFAEMRKELDRYLA